MEESQGSTFREAPMPRSLFIFSLIYGGMVTIAGVLGAKQVAIGPLAVEAGIFPFLTLVTLSSAVSELHGKPVADKLVRLGFIPLIISILLIQLVLALPTDKGMYPPAIEAFPIILGQGARMMFAGLIAYGISQTLNVMIFDKLRNAAGGALWLRGAIASAASQVIDTLLFITISFYGEREIGQLMIGQMTAKIVLSILLVPIAITLLVRLGRSLDRDATSA
jgi:queuosine precursor transporter